MKQVMRDKPGALEDSTATAEPAEAANPISPPPTRSAADASVPANDTAAAVDSGTPSVSALPPLLTVDELATFLRLDRKTVYDAIAKGEIPGARRIRRAIRISRDAVLEWLSDGQGRVPRSSRS